MERDWQFLEVFLTHNNNNKIILRTIKDGLVFYNRISKGWIRSLAEMSWWTTAFSYPTENKQKFYLIYILSKSSKSLQNIKP